MSDKTLKKQQLDNFIIVSGEPIGDVADVPVHYQYTFIDFSKTEIVTSSSFLDMENSNHEEKGWKPSNVYKIMQGKNEIIRIKSIGQIANQDDIGFDSWFIREKYYKLPCGLQTSRGSLITMPLLPKDGLFRNGIITVNSDQKINKGYNWKIYLPKEDAEKVAYPSKINYGKAYGYRTYDNYITNKNSRISFKDDDNFNSERQRILKRVYSLQSTKDSLTKNQFNTNGSFIFCYQITEYNTQDELKAAGDETSVPNLNLSLQNDKGKKISIDIPPIGTIKAQYMGQQMTGGMSAPSSDFLPSQCKRDGANLMPLFIYPTYNGLVITNSINKSASQGGNEIFIVNPEIGNYTDQLQPGDDVPVNNDISSIAAGASSIAKPKGLQYLPSIQKEAGVNDFSIMLGENSEDTQLEGIIKLNWDGCLGSFAYLPLYFFNKLEFQIYFKTQAQSKNKQKFSRSFKVYPIAKQMGKGNLSKSDMVVDASEYYTDTNTQESIYRSFVSFGRYKSVSGSSSGWVGTETINDKYSRYPIQVFGAMLAVKSTLDNSNSSNNMKNGNGKFELIPEFDEDKMIDINYNNWKADDKNYWMNFIQSCQITQSLDGVTGRITLDSYLMEESGWKLTDFDYSIGQIDLDIKYRNDTFSSIINTSSSDTADSTINTKPAETVLFKGIGLQVSKNDSDGNNVYQIELVGLQQKLQDMNLVCAPFWDGDRLQDICLYFQNYCNVGIKMFDNTVTDGGRPKLIKGGEEACWIANPQSIIDNPIYRSTQFRVPRSINWASPAIDFPTTTTCLDALKKLAEKTSCFFTVGLTGEALYYELNKYGVPYYAMNSDGEYKKSSLIIQNEDIISFSLKPQLGNRYNYFVTFGLLQKRTKSGKIDTDSLTNSTIPGSFFTKVDDEKENISIKIPWSKTMVAVQNGFLTKNELKATHLTRMAYGSSSILTGSVTVLGNTQIQYLYQIVEIFGEKFFVISIDHNLDCSSKQWTTTYQIQRLNLAQNISSSVGN